MNGLDAALANFAEVWSDGELLESIATALTCIEVDALASLLRELDHPDSADGLIAAHSAGDDEGDDHFRGDA